MANANWSNPTLTSTYVNFLSEVKNRDEDLALQFDGTTSTNIPTNAIRWDSSAGRWKKWNGSAWAELAATYALTNITATGTLSTGDSIQAGTNGGNVGIYVGQTGYSGALLYRADGSVQLSARSGYGLTFAPAPNSGTTWGQFSAGGFFGVGITPRTKVDVSGTQLTDAGSSATIGPLLAWNTTNNADTPGLQTAFTIARDGKAGVAYGNFVNFNIGRYSQSGVAAQTQLTLRLTNGNQNNPEVDVLTLLGNGNVGIGTTSPGELLHVNGAIRSSSAAVGVFANSTLMDFAGGASRFISYGPNTTTYAPIQFWQTTSNSSSASIPLSINASGNVGIGTTSPVNLLTVFDSAAAADSMVGLFNANALTSGESRSWVVANKGLNYGGAIGGYIIQGAGAGLIFGTLNGSATPVERARFDHNGNFGLGTKTPRGNLSIANNTTGATVSTSLHFGYSTSDFYGFRLVNTNNPTNTAAGTFTLQRGTTAAWADVLSVDNAGVTTFNNYIVANNGVSGAVSIGAAFGMAGYNSRTFVIPSGSFAANRVTITLSGVSLSGAAYTGLIRLGPSSGDQTTGYTSTSIFYGAPSDGTIGTLSGKYISATDGIAVNFANNAANALSGTITLTKHGNSGNTWIADGLLSFDNSSNNVCIVSGSVSLSGPYARLTLYCAAYQFDAGTISVFYEG